MVVTTACTPEGLAVRLELLDRAMLGQESSGVVEDALGDDSLMVRARAATVAAARLSPRRLVELIVRGDSLARRAAAIEALVKAGRRSLEVLMTGATSVDREEARFCLQVLGRIDAPEARLMLREATAHQDRQLRQTAFEALGVQQDREAVPVLLAAIEGDPWVAFAAIWALGEIRDLRATERLKMLDGTLFEDAARKALERIGGARAAVARA